MKECTRQSLPDVKQSPTLSKMQRQRWHLECKSILRREAYLLQNGWKSFKIYFFLRCTCFPFDVYIDIFKSDSNHGMVVTDLDNYYDQNGFFWTDHCKLRNITKSSCWPCFWLFESREFQWEIDEGDEKTSWLPQWHYYFISTIGKMTKCPRRLCSGVLMRWIFPLIILIVFRTVFLCDGQQGASVATLLPQTYNLMKVFT